MLMVANTMVSGKIILNMVMENMSTAMETNILVILNTVKKKVGEHFILMMVLFM